MVPECEKIFNDEKEKPNCIDKDLVIPKDNKTKNAFDANVGYA